MGERRMASKVAERIATKVSKPQGTDGTSSNIIKMVANGNCGTFEHLESLKNQQGKTGNNGWIDI